MLKLIFIKIVSVACFFYTVNATANSLEILPTIVKNFYSDYVSTQTLQMGFDHWFGPSQSLNNPLLNTTLSGDYSPITPWFKYAGTIRPFYDGPFYDEESNITLNMRANLDDGFILDRLDYDYPISDSLGFRFGLVNMKMNVCSLYEVDNPWIMDPSNSCRITYTSIYRSSNSSPGAQIYLNTFYDEWSIAYQIGYYKPNLLNYDPSEYGYQYLITSYNAQGGIPTKTDQNDKYGVNFQLFNPLYDLDFRVGYLFANATAKTSNYYADINANTYLLTSPNVDKNTYHLISSSLRYYIFDLGKLTLTYNFYLGSAYTSNQLFAESLTPYLAGGNTNTKVQNYGAEVSFPLGNLNQVALYLGYTALNSYDSMTSYTHNNRKTIATSYRSDYDNGLYYIAQAMLGYMDAKAISNNTMSSEVVFGLRLGYQY